MKEIWKNHKLAIIAAGYCLAVFLALFFLVSPFIGRIKEKADNIQRKKIDNEISKERIEKIPQMEEIDKLIQSKSDELDVMLDSEDEVEFIEDLEGIAEATGNKMAIKINDLEKASDVKAKKNSSEKKNEKKTIKENLSYDSYISMEISLEGNYQEMLDFVRKLENFNSYVNIISIELKKETEVKNNPKPSVSQNPSMFSVLQPRPNEKSVEEKIEKNFLSSKIGIIVYKKK